MSDLVPPADPDYELVDRLFVLHPPATTDVAHLMDDVRYRYIHLANDAVRLVPRTPDRTIALRSLHRACMDMIAAIACNQEQL